MDPVLERRLVLDQVETKPRQLALRAPADRAARSPAPVARRAPPAHRVDPVGLAGQGRDALDLLGIGYLDRPATPARACRGRASRRSSTPPRHNGPAWTSSMRRASLLDESDSGGTTSWSSARRPRSGSQTSTLRRLRSNPACNIEDGPPLSSLLGDSGRVTRGPFFMAFRQHSAPTEARLQAWAGSGCYRDRLSRVAELLVTAPGDERTRPRVPFMFPRSLFCSGNIARWRYVEALMRPRRRSRSLELALLHAVPLFGRPTTVLGFIVAGFSAASIFCSALPPAGVIGRIVSVVVPHSAWDQGEVRTRAVPIHRWLASRCPACPGNHPPSGAQGAIVVGYGRSSQCPSRDAGPVTGAGILSESTHQGRSEQLWWQRNRSTRLRSAIIRPRPLSYDLLKPPLTWRS